MKILWPFLASILIHLAGCFLFKDGFLLSRLELETVNTCSSMVPQGCPEPRFERVLLIMIDALRFDFMAHSNGTGHYLNQMPLFESILKSQKPGWHGLMYRGQADPPTTTLQRLIALMTGALPTLVDASSNFGSLAIREDNLVAQLHASKKRVVSMGDDTWDRLFPSLLNVSFPYPSFDVWDLHSVDEGVISHLFPALNESVHDWGLLIAHFLGVDHAGHRYGPGHPAMASKLRQLNRVVEDAFTLVDDDTLVGSLKQV